MVAQEQSGFCLWSPARHSEHAHSVQNHSCFLQMLEQHKVQGVGADTVSSS